MAMQTARSKLRIALVYPPYGPPNLASLGLAILSAGAKARGFDCRTFYWNYQFADALPHATTEQKRRAYSLLTQRNYFPWSEWAFTRSILADALAPRDAEVVRRLRALDADSILNTGDIPPSQLILYICNNAHRLVADMADQLAAYDVIGIGTTFFQNGAGLALAKCIKERWPDKKTVLGGANCDGEMGQGLIAKFPFLDFVFTGEVDHSFPEFLERLDTGRPLAEVPGLLMRAADGSIVSGPAAAPIEQMDELPVPDFDDYVAERKRHARYVEDELCLPLESSRGCWWGAKHHCLFCGLNANGMAYRQKSPERFQDEVRTIVDRYGARYLFMADNILSTKYYRDFVRWAKEQDLRVDFFYEIKANVDRDQVAGLADAGITMVQPGIESFSTKILRLMQKGVKGIQNVAFLKFAMEYGVAPAYNILGGFPGEDPFEYERMARQIPKLVHFAPPNGVIDIEFHRFSPFHNNPAAFGIKLRPHESYSFVYPFPEADLAKVAYRFELANRFPLDLSYLAGLSHAVAQWTAHYRPGECTLTWRHDGPDIVIADRRPSFAPANYRLRDHAVRVFHALDAPTSLGAASEKSIELARNEAPVQVSSRPDADRRAAGGHAAEREISFTCEQFANAPKDCLADLVSAGLVYTDDDLYVTLPVVADRRAQNEGWGRLGI